MEIILSFINILGIILGVFGVTTIQYLRVNKERHDILEKTKSFVYVGLFLTLIYTFYRFVPGAISYTKVSMLFLIMLFYILEAYKIVRVRFAESFCLTAWYFILVITFFKVSGLPIAGLISVFFFLWFFIYLIVRALYFEKSENI